MTQPVTVQLSMNDLSMLVTFEIFTNRTSFESELIHFMISGLAHIINRMVIVFISKN